MIFKVIFHNHTDTSHRGFQVVLVTHSCLSCWLCFYFLITTFRLTLHFLRLCVSHQFDCLPRPYCFHLCLTMFPSLEVLSVCLFLYSVPFHLSTMSASRDYLFTVVCFSGLLDFWFLTSSSSFPCWNCLPVLIGYLCEQFWQVKIFYSSIFILRTWVVHLSPLASSDTFDHIKKATVNVHLKV